MSTTTRIDSINRRCMCDCITCCYFTLAAFLFTTGTTVTILYLYGNRVVTGLGNLWLIGPVFLSSGLMIAVKTALYARRQSMVALLTRRQQEFCSPVEDIPSPRDPANYILPPSYDSIAGECSTQTSSHLLPPNNNTIMYNVVGVSPPNHPPPCYEEALYGSSIETIHFQGIKGYCLAKSTGHPNDCEDDTLNAKNDEREER